MHINNRSPRISVAESMTAQCGRMREAAAKAAKWLYAAGSALDRLIQVISTTHLAFHSDRGGGITSSNTE